jgi:hypothetical protein
MSSVVKYITVAVCIVVVTCQRSPLVSAIHTKTYCDYLLLESTLLGQYSTPFGEAIGLKVHKAYTNNGWSKEYKNAFLARGFTKPHPSC